MASGSEGRGSRPVAERRLGRYELLAEVGETAMGTVTAARVALGAERGRQVLLRRVEKGSDHDDATLRAYREAASEVLGVGHARVLPGLEVRLGTSLVVASAYREGELLRTLLEATRSPAEPMPPAVATSLIADLVTTLVEVDAGLAENGLGRPLAGLCPDAVLVDLAGACHLVDLGLVTLQRPPRHAELMAYRAPEQLGPPGAADERSVVFSVGVLWWELLANHSLFGGGNQAAVWQRVRQAPIVPPAAATEPQREALMRALQREPAARFATLSDFSVAFAALPDGARAPQAAVVAFLERVLGPRIAARRAALEVEPLPSVPPGAVPSMPVAVGDLPTIAVLPDLPRPASFVSVPPAEPVPDEDDWEAEGPPSPRGDRRPAPLSSPPGVVTAAGVHPASPPRPGPGDGRSTATPHPGHPGPGERSARAALAPRVGPGEATPTPSSPDPAAANPSGAASPVRSAAPPDVEPPTSAPMTPAPRVRIQPSPPRIGRTTTAAAGSSAEPSGGDAVRVPTAPTETKPTLPPAPPVDLALESPFPPPAVAALPPRESRGESAPSPGPSPLGSADLERSPFDSEVPPPSQRETVEMGRLVDLAGAAVRTEAESSPSVGTPAVDSDRPLVSESLAGPRVRGGSYRPPGVPFAGELPGDFASTTAGLESLAETVRRDADDRARDPDAAMDLAPTGLADESAPGRGGVPAWAVGGVVSFVVAFAAVAVAYFVLWGQPRAGTPTSAPTAPVPQVDAPVDSFPSEPDRPPGAPSAGPSASLDSVPSPPLVAAPSSVPSAAPEQAPSPPLAVPPPASGASQPPRERAAPAARGPSDTAPSPPPSAASRPVGDDPGRPGGEAGSGAPVRPAAVPEPTPDESSPYD